MEKRTLTLLILLFAVLVGSLHLGFKRQPDLGEAHDMSRMLKAPGSWQGKVAPDFELETIDGGTFRLSEHVGKEIVVLNFFATWCGPCQEEMPELTLFHAQNKDKDVVLLGIDASEKKGAVEAFVRKHNVEYPVGIAASEELQNRYGVMGFPTTVFIGVDGRIQLYEVGPIMNSEIAFKQLVEMNRKLLAEGKGISQEEYLKLAGKESYKDVREKPEKDPLELEGRAKEIAQQMTCPCGCSHKVVECGCDTSQKIKKKLKEGNFGEKTDVDIMKELNAEFCLKESEC